MNAQTKLPAYTPATARQMEDALLAGLMAEGREGKGKAPDFSDGKTAGRRGGNRRDSGVMGRIVEALASGCENSGQVAAQVGICSRFASAYLNKLHKAGRIKVHGTVKVNGATMKLWSLT